MCGPRGAADVVRAQERPIVSVRDVLRDCCVEKHGILTNNGDIFSEVSGVHLVDIVRVDRDLPRCWFVKTLKKGDHR